MTIGSRLCWIGVFFMVRVCLAIGVENGQPCRVRAHLGLIGGANGAHGLLGLGERPTRLAGEMRGNGGLIVLVSFQSFLVEWMCGVHGGGREWGVLETRVLRQRLLATRNAHPIGQIAFPLGEVHFLIEFQGARTDGRESERGVTNFLLTVRLDDV